MFIIVIMFGIVSKKEGRRFLNQYYSSMNTTNETMSLIIMVSPEEQELIDLLKFVPES